MNLFIAIGLLFGMFTTGKCITCLLCNEFYYLVPYSGDNVYQSCSGNVREMICPQGIPTCMTRMVHYIHGSPHTHSHIYTRRGCVPEDIVSSISSGDHCVEQSVVDAYLSAEYPAVRKSHTEYQTRITNVTFCVCDNADKYCPLTAESVPGSGEAEGSSEASGTFRTCIACKEITSDHVVIDPGDSDIVSCSDNPDEMICSDGISACMTGVADVAYRLQSGQNVTIRDVKRACAPEEIVSSIPSGDHCVKQSVVDAYFSDNDPAELYPDINGMLFLGITNASFCVCDSADKCTPPSPTVDSPSTGAEGGTGTGKGDLRTCINCKEITSDGNITYPGDTELVSCSDNPGEMICPEGISTCITGVVNIAYMLGTGQTVTLTVERRTCAPKDVVASTSPGDHCVDQSVVGAFFSDNDPAELFPDTEEMIFDRLLNATFCVCDSADKCTPPSQANSAVNLESTLGLFIASLIYALFCGLKDKR